MQHPEHLLSSVMEQEIEREGLLSCEDEDSLLDQEREQTVSDPLSVVQRLTQWWPVLELWMLVKLAIPTMLMLFFQQFVYISAVLFAGHISGTSRDLDAAALALSVSNVTGLAVIIGLASAGDTLCPQSFGFKNYKRVGEVFQQGVLILSVATLPIVGIWLSSERLLSLLQQPPCVVQLASQFLMIFILILPPLIVTFMLQKYLQAQSVVWVFALTGLLYNLLTVLFCALFIYGLHLGVYSVAVALVLSAYLSTTFLVIYIKVRGIHKLTWGGWSIRSLDNWWPFLKLGLPGFLMLAFEWWTFEITAFVSGSLNETELGVNTILLQLLSLLFMFPLGTGTAASVRVGNELGAGNATRAKRVSYTAVCLQVVIVSCLVVVLGLSHDVIGRLFTEDEDVIEKTSNAMYSAIPLIFFDHVQGTISGVFRGAGLQLVAAAINFVVYYIIGLPTGICLALLTSLGTLGMWIGLSIASFCQCSVFTVILFTLNWNKLAKRAMKVAAAGSPNTDSSAMLSFQESTDGPVEEIALTSYKDVEEPLVSMETSLTSISTQTTPSDPSTVATSSSDKAPTTQVNEKKNPSTEASLLNEEDPSTQNTLLSYDDPSVKASLSNENNPCTLLNEDNPSTEVSLSNGLSADTHQLIPSSIDALPLGPSYTVRRKVRLLLCKGLIVVIGLCFIVVSGTLAGLFTFSDPHRYQECLSSNDSCCSVMQSSVNLAISPTRTSCLCTVSTLVLAPTPLPYH